MAREDAAIDAWTTRDTGFLITIFALSVAFILLVVAFFAKPIKNYAIAKRNRQLANDLRRFNNILKQENEDLMKEAARCTCKWNRAAPSTPAQPLINPLQIPRHTYRPVGNAVQVPRQAHAPTGNATQVPGRASIEMATFNQRQGEPSQKSDPFADFDGCFVVGDDEDSDSDVSPRTVIKDKAFPPTPGTAVSDTHPAVHVPDAASPSQAARKGRTLA